LEILVAKEKADDYTAIEKLLIVTEGMRQDNVRKFVKEFNISHDTFYAWKKDLMAQINIIWSDNKSELKRLETFEEKENEINTLQTEIKNLNKEMNTLFRQLEQAHLENFKMEILWSTVPEQFKDKIPLKYYKTAVIQEIEKLQHINLEEACAALKIAVGTLRSWKRDVDEKKTQ
jgi:predicted RNase H-like nuclease (RuvC/YqgF family)